MRSIALTLLTGTLLVVPSHAAAQTATDPELQEWVVPYEASTPRYPMVGPDGRVWFVGQRSDYVSVLDPETNSIWFGADTNTVGVARLPPRRRAISY